MATAQQIINRALRICTVLDSAEAAAGAEAADALLILNGLLAEWHEAEIGLPDYTLATLATDLASDAANRDAIAYQLALRLAPEYGRELPALAMAVADQTMSRLRLRYFQPGKTDYSELPSAQPGSYNVKTDA